MYGHKGLMSVVSPSLVTTASAVRSCHTQTRRSVAYCAIAPTRDLADIATANRAGPR